MGYKIYVDHSTFINGANKIDEYLAVVDNYMTLMNENVDDMLTSWSSDDALAFSQKWQTATGKNSRTGVMQSDLKKYAENLRNIGNNYKNAQIDSINEANNLPRWF